jgi:hypothetical protein
MSRGTKQSKMLSDCIPERRLPLAIAKPGFLILILPLLCITRISAFVVPFCSSRFLVTSQGNWDKSVASVTEMRALVAEEGKEKEILSVVDKNGNEISEGMIVRVVQATKAHQVPPSARGKFDENKQFVPCLQGVGRKYLVVPEGMCGIVTKVYVHVNLSANFKVQVKFAPCEAYNKDGFDPPIQFLMHFSGMEVECVI